MLLRLNPSQTFASTINGENLSIDYKYAYKTLAKDFKTPLLFKVDT